MIPYPAKWFGEQALRELNEQAIYYDSSYNLVDAISRLYKCGGEYEMLVSRVGFKKGEDEAWTPLGRLMEDMPEILED